MTDGIHNEARLLKLIEQINDHEPVHGFAIPTSVEKTAARCRNSLRLATEGLDAALTDLQHAALVHGRTQLEVALGDRLSRTIERYEAIGKALKQLDDVDHPSFAELPAESIDGPLPEWVRLESNL